MSYYEDNHEEERAERIFNIFTKIIIGIIIAILIIGYFMIDLEKIDNDIKTEKNE